MASLVIKKSMVVSLSFVKLGHSSFCNKSKDGLPINVFIQIAYQCVFLRYELPQPAAGKMSDVSAWVECVDNSMAQLEHQNTRYATLLLHISY